MPTSSTSIRKVDSELSQVIFQRKSYQATEPLYLKKKKKNLTSRLRDLMRFAHKAHMDAVAKASDNKHDSL